MEKNKPIINIEALFYNFSSYNKSADCQMLDKHDAENFVKEAIKQTLDHVLKVVGEEVKIGIYTPNDDLFNVKSVITTHSSSYYKVYIDKELKEKLKEELGI